jgi:ATP-dependent DNA ligase
VGATTRRFPNFATPIAKVAARTLVLDGEVAIYDQQLRSPFDWLREPDPGAVATPPIFIAFDVMFCDRRDLTDLPLSARRIHLEDVITGADLVFPVRRLAANGLDAGLRLSATATIAWSRGQRVRGRADEAVGEG